MSVQCKPLTEQQGEIERRQGEPGKISDCANSIQPVKVIQNLVLRLSKPKTSRVPLCDSDWLQPFNAPATTPLEPPQAWALFLSRSFSLTEVRLLGLKGTSTFAPAQRVHREQRCKNTTYHKATFPQSHPLSLNLDTHLPLQRQDREGKSTME